MGGQRQGRAILPLPVPWPWPCSLPCSARPNPGAPTRFPGEGHRSEEKEAGDPCAGPAGGRGGHRGPGKAAPLRMRCRWPWGSHVSSWRTRGGRKVLQGRPPTRWGACAGLARCPGTSQAWPFPGAPGGQRPGEGLPPGATGLRVVPASPRAGSPCPLASPDRGLRLASRSRAPAGGPLWAHEAVL